jgi:hypothetical protein
MTTTDDRRCIDCGTDTLPIEWGPRAEYFIVTDEIWAAAGMTKTGGCLCIGCLEARIGRQLTASDFPADIPLNDLSIADVMRYAWSWRTPRLVERLSRPGPGRGPTRRTPRHQHRITPQDSDNTRCQSNKLTPKERSPTHVPPAQ